MDAPPAAGSYNNVTPLDIALAGDTPSQKNKARYTHRPGSSLGSWSQNI